MKKDAMWFTLLGFCSGCGKPAVFERWTDRVVTKLDGEEHDAEACKAARDEAAKRAKKGVAA